MIKLFILRNEECLDTFLMVSAYRFEDALSGIPTFGKIELNFYSSPILQLSFSVKIANCTAYTLLHLLMLSSEYEVLALPLRLLSCTVRLYFSLCIEITWFMLCFTRNYGKDTWAEKWDGQSGVFWVSLHGWCALWSQANTGTVSLILPYNKQYSFTV